MRLLIALIALPAIYWPYGIDHAAALKSAGIERVAVPADQADAWKAQGFTVEPAVDLSSRLSLAAPGIVTRPAVASPTRSPWAALNGWRLLRNPSARYVYESRAGSGALAAAEAFAYNADAVLRIEQGDVQDVGRMLAFLRTLPALDLPPVADIGVVDDGSTEIGEVMNMLVRRNLLFRAGPTPFVQFKVNIRLGSPEYPRAEAADPGALALKVRRQLGDEQRSLRIYGSDTVIGHLTSDGPRARLHLLNYAGREVEGLRIRVRGAYAQGRGYIAERGAVALADFSAADGATEFSLPALRSYTVVDLAQK